MYWKWIKENSEILNLSGIAKVAGIKRMTFNDILYNPDRWEAEDFRVEGVCKHIRESINETTRKKYGGR